MVIKNNGDIDPDDAFSRIPYEKGFSLLWYLQSIFGVEKFEAFLKGNQDVKYKLYFHKNEPFISGKVCFEESIHFGELTFSETSPVSFRNIYKLRKVLISRKVPQSLFVKQ